MYSMYTGDKKNDMMSYAVSRTIDTNTVAPFQFRPRAEQAFCVPDLLQSSVNTFVSLESEQCKSRHSLLTETLGLQSSSPYRSNIELQQPFDIALNIRVYMPALT